MTKKFPILNFAFAISLVAVLVAWYCDHARLQAANERLNEECAELFMTPVEPYWADLSASERRPRLDSRQVIKLSYDAHDPVDRARYKHSRESAE